MGRTTPGVGRGSDNTEGRLQYAEQLDLQAPIPTESGEEEEVAALRPARPQPRCQRRQQGEDGDASGDLGALFGPDHNSSVIK
jgi:hypothetical protein